MLRGIFKVKAEPKLTDVSAPVLFIVHVPPSIVPADWVIV